MGLVLLGFQYFTAFYGRSSDVFGAVPSLHVAYPLLMAVVGWPLHKAFGRTALVLWYLWMCVAALYLDHHWMIDVVIGSAYAIAVNAAMRAVVSALKKRAEDVTPVLAGAVED